MVVIARSKHWDSVALKTQCKEWFSLLVKTVEIKGGAENTLQLLLLSDRGVTNNEDYRSHIETEVINIRSLKDCLILSHTLFVKSKLCYCNTAR